MLTFSPSQWMEKGGKIQKSSSASFPPHNFINSQASTKWCPFPVLLPHSPNPQKGFAHFLQQSHSHWLK
jgi:hypothetical protein